MNQARKRERRTSDTFPGRFTTVSPAVALHVDLDLLSKGVNRMALSTHGEGGSQFLAEPTELAGKLLLAERSYL